MSSGHKIPKRKKRNENSQDNQNNLSNNNINPPISNPLNSNQPISNPLQNPNQMDFTNHNYSTAQVNAFNPFAIQEDERIKRERRMRHRHEMDGAVNIQIEEDDLQNEKYELYVNQDINYEKPKINENISKENTNYYIESIHHDRFIKIEKKKEKTEEPKEPSQVQAEAEAIARQEPKREKLKAKKPLTALDIEKKMFEKFENKLNDIIDKTIGKVTIIFLFTSALLSGMGLLHLIFFTTYNEYEAFRNNYAESVMLIYEIFHALTFASLVGNGIKFVMAWKRYDVIASRFNKSSISEFTNLRRKMIFSGVLLCLFTVTFILEIYLATFIQLFNHIKCPKEREHITDENYYKQNLKLITESDFKKFKGVHLVVDILVIIIFILNIFDVNVTGEKTETIIQPKIEYNYYFTEDDENQNLLR
jgi:hypothetical protein